MKWYDDKDALVEALRENDGNVTETARKKRTSRTTLREAILRHGIVLFETVKEIETDPNPALVLENRRLRQAADRASKGEVAEERVLQRIEEAAKAVSVSYTPRTRVVEAPEDRTAQELVLGWSDLHAAEVVSLEETRGINEYDWSIMEARMASTQESVFSHADHFGFKVSKLHIAMLGDMLSGDIHEELAITNDRPLAEAVVDLAASHVPWLLNFADHFGKVKISGVPGNHPRSTKKPKMKQAHDNADWLFYHFLRALLDKDDRFEFDIPRGAFNVVTFADRWRALLMHGDGIRTTMPGVPWGGVVRRITTLESQFVAARQPLDFVMLGHFHTRNSLDGVQSQVFLNGSVKGPDEYSLKQFGSGRPASQTLLTFHPKRGWTGQYALNLQGVRPGSEGW